MKDDYISNNIDLGIRYGTGAWDNLSCVPLMDEYTFPVCSPHYLTTLDLNASPYTVLHSSMHLSWTGIPTFHAGNAG